MAATDILLATCRSPMRLLLLAEEPRTRVPPSARRFVAPTPCRFFVVVP
jgi:hypothetical protein